MQTLNHDIEDVKNNLNIRLANEIKNLNEKLDREVTFKFDNQIQNVNQDIKDVKKTLNTC